jgi:hypothetical protein
MRARHARPSYALQAGHPQTALRPFGGWPARRAGALRPSSYPMDNPRRTARGAEAVKAAARWFGMRRTGDTRRGRKLEAPSEALRVAVPRPTGRRVGGGRLKSVFELVEENRFEFSRVGFCPKVLALKGYRLFRDLLPPPPPPPPPLPLLAPLKIQMSCFPSAPGSRSLENGIDFGC